MDSRPSEKPKSSYSPRVSHFIIKDFSKVFTKPKSPAKLEAITERFNKFPTNFSKSPSSSNLRKLSTAQKHLPSTPHSTSPPARLKVITLNTLAPIPPTTPKNSVKLKKLAEIILTRPKKTLVSPKESQKKFSPRLLTLQNFSFASRTQTGEHQSIIKSHNQDASLIFPQFSNSPNSILMGVMDGHGVHGHLVSSFLQTSIPSFLAPLSNTLNSSASAPQLVLLKSLIKASFSSLQSSLLRIQEISANLSGSTANIVVIHQTLCLCANLGDSRAVLGRLHETWKAIPLSSDHKPSVPTEKKRIEKSGGWVEPCIDHHGKFVGPERVWIKGEFMPGLAVSRAFGDVLASSVGVISDPEVIALELETWDKFIVIGSDGLWEVFKNLEVVKIIGKYFERGNVEKAADVLMEKCLGRWKRKGGSVDDVTFVILFFK